MKTAVVTGASSGIGHALCKEFASHGYHVIALARRQMQLERLCSEIKAAQGSATFHVCDVNRAEDLLHSAQEIEKTYGKVDVVIAGAGFGVGGSFSSLSESDFHRQFDTNVFGVIRTAQAFAPLLKKSKGVFAVITSVSAYATIPGTIAYSMSKYAARSLTEGLRSEWSTDQIAVLEVAPGFVESEIRKTTKDGSHIQDPVPTWLQMPAQTAARKIVKAVVRRRTLLILTLHGKALYHVSRLFPGLVRLLTPIAAKKTKKI